MNNVKRLLAAVLAAALMICVLPLGAFAGETVSGTCGQRLSWSFDPNTGKLTISGTGPMQYYEKAEDTPWFAFADSIRGITINSGVTAIGSMAFQSLTALESVSIPYSVAEVGYYAFFGCESLKRVSIFDLRAWLKVDFSDPYANPLKNGGMLYVNGQPLTGHLAIPQGVTQIPVGAFRGSTGLTSVTVPDSVQWIGEEAFSGCSGLKTMTLPFVGQQKRTAEDLQQYPFGYIFGTDPYPGALETRQDYYGESLDYTDLALYQIPGSLESVTITGGEILSCAFIRCTGLKTVIIGEGVGGVGSSAFQGCTGLKTVTLPQSADQIGTYAFKDCKSLESVAIPQGVTRIGNYAFHNCKAMKSVTIPSGVAEIGGGAFYNCAALQSLELPKTITTLGNFSFSGCTGLKEIRFAGSAPKFGTGCLQRVSATAYYPADNLTWVGNACQNYGGTLAWEKHCPDGHRPSIRPAVTATCTEDGLTQGKYCTVCGEELIAQEVIPATGHREVTDEGKTPTCTEPGLTPGSHCAACGEVLIAQEVIPATGHREVTDEEKLPTCTEPGLTRGSHCSVCGEILTSQEPVAALGHTYSGKTDEDCDRCGQLRELVVPTTPMYRLYNPNSGEHFYTGSGEERDLLTEAGWVYEGVAWNAPTESGDPVYRLYNPNSGDHHYTMSAEERDLLVGHGWAYEGVAWNSAPATEIPLYRLYNPNAHCGSHHYTGSEEEREMLVGCGWIYEGIGWFGMLK